VVGALEGPGRQAGSLDLAKASIAGRLSAQLEDVVTAVVETLRSSIPEYGTLSRALLDEVAGVTRVNIVTLLEQLSAEEPFTREALEDSRDGLARRAQQGISLESALQAIRLWGQVVWSAVVGATRTDRRDELQAALWIGSRIMQHVDAVSRLAEEHWLEAARGHWSHQEVMRRDLLELLIAGKGGTEAAQRLAAALDLKLPDQYVAVLVRGADLATGETHDRTFASRLRAALKEAERHLAVPGEHVLVGMRHSEIVCLHPVGDYDDLHDLKEHCQELGLSLVPVGTKIGIGGWHPTLAGVTSSYAEAREAVTRALREDRETRVVAFDDIVVDHLLRSSPSAAARLRPAGAIAAVGDPPQIRRGGHQPHEDRQRDARSSEHDRLPAGTHPGRHRPRSHGP
jgi:hypothetical protein